MRTKALNAHLDSRGSRARGVMLLLSCAAKHGRDLPPSVEPTQLDLPARHEAEDEYKRRVLARQ